MQEVAGVGCPGCAGRCGLSGLTPQDVGFFNQAGLLGLPVLEAYQYDRPALVSDSSSLRELAPPECRFDPTDPTMLYVTESVSGSILRARMAEPGSTLHTPAASAAWLRQSLS